MPGPGGPEGEAQGDSRGGGGAASKPEIGDIGAGGEEHKTDEAHQDAQRLGILAAAIVFTLAARVGGERADRFGHRAPGVISSRIRPDTPAFAGGFLQDRFQARARLCGGSLGPDDPSRSILHHYQGWALFAPRSGLKRRCVSQGHADVCGFADLQRAREAGRSDADDRRALD